MTFLQAAAFQWVNPKAFVAALSGVAVYMRPGHEREDFAIVLAVFALATALSTATWAGFGVGAAPLPARPGACANFQCRHGPAAGRQHLSDRHRMKKPPGLVAPRPAS